MGPGLKVLTQVVQRVMVLGEHEQLSPSILEFVELGTLRTLSQRNQLGVAAAVAHGEHIDYAHALTVAMASWIQATPDRRLGRRPGTGIRRREGRRPRGESTLCGARAQSEECTLVRRFVASVWKVRPMMWRKADGLLETVGVIGNLIEGISLLFTGIIFLVITAAISGVMFWFSWLLLFGG